MLTDNQPFDVKVSIVIPDDNEMQFSIVVAMDKKVFHTNEFNHIVERVVDVVKEKLMRETLRAKHIARNLAYITQDGGD
jgi:hypothetical protein